jgi:hypothetical protein
MCLGSIRQYVQPDSKLSKMVSFGKIILIVNIIISFVRLFIRPADMLYDLICAMFLLMAVFYIYFVYMAIYVIFALFISFYLVIGLSIKVQFMLQTGKQEKNDFVVLALTIFLLVFYVFAIIFTFPMYKEMKAQLMGDGNAYRPQVDASGNRAGDDQERGQSGDRGFAAFSGRGVAVAGN